MCGIAWCHPCIAVSISQQPLLHVHQLCLPNTIACSLEVSMEFVIEWALREETWITLCMYLIILILPDNYSYFIEYSNLVWLQKRAKSETQRQDFWMSVVVIWPLNSATVSQVVIDLLVFFSTKCIKWVHKVEVMFTHLPSLVVHHQNSSTYFNEIYLTHTKICHTFSFGSCWSDLILIRCSVLV